MDLVFLMVGYDDFVWLDLCIGIIVEVKFYFCLICNYIVQIVLGEQML